MKPNAQTLIFVVVAIVLVFGLNHIYSKNPGFSDPNAGPLDATQQQSRPQPTSPPQPAPPVREHPQVTTNSSASKVDASRTQPPTELILGNPDSAATRVTIGYTMDDKLQANPSGVNQVIGDAQMWQKAHSNDSVQVVCVDVPPSERSDPRNSSVPLGVTVNGATKLAGNPGEQAGDPALVAAALFAQK